MCVSVVVWAALFVALQKKLLLQSIMTSAGGAFSAGQRRSRYQRLCDPCVCVSIGVCVCMCVRFGGAPRGPAERVLPVVFLTTGRHVTICRVSRINVCVGGRV